MKPGAVILPDDPILLKQMLLLASEQAAAKDAQIEHLQEQIALLRHKLFSPKSEQTVDSDSPQLPLLNEAEVLLEVVPETSTEQADEEVVAPVKRRGKRKPLPANLPRIEIIHELPEHELPTAHRILIATPRQRKTGFMERLQRSRNHPGAQPPLR